MTSVEAGRGGTTGTADARHLAEVARIAGVSVPEIVLPEERHVVLGGMRLHYLDWGTPRGETVVFLHGGGLSAHTWDIVCLALRHDYHCYALDLRGHGDSEWSPTLDYGLDANVRDLEGFLDHLDVERLFLVGQSLGGLVATGYASQHSERLAGLVVVDVSPFPPEESGLARVRNFMLGASDFDSLEAAVDYAVAFNQKRDRRLLRHSLEHNLRRLPDGRWTWKRDQRHLGETYFADCIAEFGTLAQAARFIRCPTLLVRGGNSAFTREAAAKFAALLEQGRTVTVEDAGHNVQGDNPAGFLDALRPFLTEHRPRASVPS